MQVLREGVLRYVTDRVDHKDNPEKFQNELELQLEKHAQRKQQKSLLKLRHQLAKQQLSKQDMDTRAVLQAHITLKMKSAAVKRAAKKEQTVLENAPERKIREQMRGQQIMKHRVNLQQSLKKIAEIETRYVASTNLTPFLRGSQSVMMLTKEQKQYGKKVEIETSKQAIQQPRKQLSSLFFARVDHHREVELQKHQKQMAKLEETMLKMEEARRKKQMLMKEKSRHMRQAAEWQEQLRQERLKGERIRDIEQMQKWKIDKGRTADMIDTNDLSNYRQQISQAIEEYFRVGK